MVCYHDYVYLLVSNLELNTLRNLSKRIRHVRTAVLTRDLYRASFYARTESTCTGLRIELIPRSEAIENQSDLTEIH